MLVVCLFLFVYFCCLLGWIGCFCVVACCSVCFLFLLVISCDCSSYFIWEFLKTFFMLFSFLIGLLDFRDCFSFFGVLFLFVWLVVCVSVLFLSLLFFVLYLFVFVGGIVCFCFLFLFFCGFLVVYLICFFCLLGCCFGGLFCCFLLGFLCVMLFCFWLFI